MSEHAHNEATGLCQLCYDSGEQVGLHKGLTISNGVMMGQQTNRIGAWIVFGLTAVISVIGLWWGVIVGVIHL